MAGTTCFVRKAAPNTSIRSPWPVREPWMSFRSKACRAIRSSPTSIPPAPTCKAGAWSTRGYARRRMVLRFTVWQALAARERAGSWRARLVHARRETSIQKVEWDGDGWPYVVGGHGGERYVEAPADAIATEAPTDHSQHDEFESSELTSTGTPCVCHSPRPWAAWAAAR